MDAIESSRLEGVLNFRDTGKTVNEFLGERRVREGALYRSARPDDATPQDRFILQNDLGIKTIIDLRTKTEHLRQAERHQARIQAGIATEPMHIDGIQYQNIKLTGRAFEIHLVRQLSWWSFLKLIVLFVLGYRMKAINIIGREVMLQRGLIGLGLDTLDQSGPEIREALSLYANPQSLPILVHCTQGKDRTGLITALVLMILGVPTPAIERDYFLTDAALRSDRAERLREIRELGLTDDWADTHRDMISAIQNHLESRYGGLDAYLDHIGLDMTGRSRIRSALLY